MCCMRTEKQTYTEGSSAVEVSPSLRHLRRRRDSRLFSENCEHLKEVME